MSKRKTRQRRTHYAKPWGKTPACGVLAQLDSKGAKLTTVVSNDPAQVTCKRCKLSASYRHRLKESQK